MDEFNRRFLGRVLPFLFSEQTAMYLYKYTEQNHMCNTYMHVNHFPCCLLRCYVWLMCVYEHEHTHTNKQVIHTARIILCYLDSKRWRMQNAFLRTEWIVVVVVVAVGKKCTNCIRNTKQVRTYTHACKQTHTH